MPWSTCSRLVQKKMGEKNFSYGNACLFLAFSMACGRWGHLFALSANPRSCEKKLTKSLSFIGRGKEYDTKMCNNRIDGASGICEGDHFRRLISTKRKHEKQDRPFLEA